MGGRIGPGSTVPGVQAVATVDTVPMREGNNQLGYWTSAALPPREDSRSRWRRASRQSIST